MDLFEHLLSAAQVWLATFAGVFLRVGACFFVLPGLGEQMIPLRVRLGAALAMSLLLTPMLHGEIAITGLMPPRQAFLSEAVIGLCLGLALRFMVYALQTAGTIAAQATSLSQIMGGASPDPLPAMGAILSLAGIALVVLTGLHVHMASAFLQSYALFPFGALPAPSHLAEWGISRVSASFALAFSLSAPFLIASLLYNVALGVINKAMPQLMVAFVGAPAITWGGVGLLMLVTPAILTSWSAAFDATLANPWAAP
ncbi:MAG: flagellar biosynthetic protein FliR [Rhodobacteraceae bacterium HLUCCO18]|nr:MAG: flagellar biosynthetic protein FliR [Rhodobacteraceae bacterium HLUCCO18]